jgi:hypothetical protein
LAAAAAAATTPTSAVYASMRVFMSAIFIKNQRERTMGGCERALLRARVNESKGVTYGETAERVFGATAVDERRNRTAWSGNNH